MTVKLSVSLADRDVAILDRYMKATGTTSRSAVIQRAIRLLGDPGLGDDYLAAWDEWAQSDDAELWETTVGDGITHAQG
ncbi:ribbon-helix-helix domain-containing protein [Tessaracoccus caeni]|uniref:ribbon-helix-helix domain-containing protein n=1 Tax=Tessaracoccus caeni TaxID=3031239 RepID=UPI0023DC7F90|nr:ribbon-helix-helix domain-containing protein [Tessaracoccus caeni]MDF1487742.1 ribbon-helix-helix domain-containing protein [Tessaracoccus caeni]